jgi:hypothetical protein
LGGRNVVLTERDPDKEARHDRLINIRRVGSAPDAFDAHDAPQDPLHVGFVLPEHLRCGLFVAGPHALKQFFKGTHQNIPGEIDGHEGPRRKHCIWVAGRCKDFRVGRIGNPSHNHPPDGRFRPTARLSALLSARRRLPASMLSTVDTRSQASRPIMVTIVLQTSVLQGLVNQIPDVPACLSR